MIYTTGKVEHLIQVAHKVSQSKVKGLNPAMFLKYMISGIQKKSVTVLVALKSKDAKKILGATVFSIIQPDEKVAIWIDFTWINPKGKDLGLEFLKAVGDIGKGLGITRIQGRMARNSRAAEKKYGFKEIYKVVEKIIG